MMLLSLEMMSMAGMLTVPPYPIMKVRAGPSRQVPAQRLRSLLRNEVEDDFGALAIAQFQNFLGRTVVC